MLVVGFYHVNCHTFAVHVDDPIYDCWCGAAVTEWVELITVGV